MMYLNGFWNGWNGLWGLVALVAAIWVIYDVLVNNKSLTTSMKVIWIVLAVLFSIITAIVYFFVGRSRSKQPHWRRGRHETQRW